MKDISIYRQHIQNQRLNKPANDSKKYIPEEHKKFAKALETQFAELMLKEMNKTVPNMAKGTADAYYQNLMTSERAKQMANNDSSKIQEMILNEVYPQRFRNKANFDAYTQQQNRFNNHKIEKHQFVGPQVEMSHESKSEISMGTGDKHEQ